jgi:hypothetical protein
MSRVQRIMVGAAVVVMGAFGVVSPAGNRPIPEASAVGSEPISAQRAWTFPQPDAVLCCRGCPWLCRS